jgi:hypothetical protein
MLHEWMTATTPCAAWKNSPKHVFSVSKDDIAERDPTRMKSSPLAIPTAPEAEEV